MRAKFPSCPPWCTGHGALSDWEPLANSADEVLDHEKDIGAVRGLGWSVAATIVATDVRVGQTILPGAPRVQLFVDQRSGLSLDVEQMAELQGMLTAAMDSLGSVSNG